MKLEYKNKKTVTKSLPFIGKNYMYLSVFDDI